MVQGIKYDKEVYSEDMEMMLLLTNTEKQTEFNDSVRMRVFVRSLLSRPANYKQKK